MEFKFKGQSYMLDKQYWDNQYIENPMLNTTYDFQNQQIEFLIKVRDWVTLENRIIGMLKWGGISKL
jgi:hypothetical protein